MSDNLVTVVLPAYKEADNLPLIVPDIADALGERLGEILIVDDNSPDETRGVVDRLIREKYPVQLWTRYRERGLSSAILYGLNHAIYDRVIVMDADGQHPPELLPRMVAALDRVDLVAATRRSEGGDASKFSRVRQVLSQVSNYLAWPLCRQSDRTGGFFGVRRDVVRNVPLDTIGWKMGLEIFVKGNYNTFTEIPYTFGERWSGQSKASLAHGLEYLHHLARLYAWKFGLRQLAQFCLVGAAGVVINMAVLTALVEWFGADYRIGALFGIMLAMLSNYALNRAWTFRGNGPRRKYVRLER